MDILFLQSVPVIITFQSANKTNAITGKNCY